MVSAQCLPPRQLADGEACHVSNSCSIFIMVFFIVDTLPTKCLRHMSAVFFYVAVCPSHSLSFATIMFLFHLVNFPV